jgi:O-antigen/teichoic acid export membrane protein
VSNAATHGLYAIARGSAFVFTCRVTGAAFALLLQVMLARWMGAAELGIYVLAFSWCVTLATISHLGFAAASVRVIGEAMAQENPGRIWGFLRRTRQIVAVASLLTAATGAIVIVLSKGLLDIGATAPFLLAMAIVPVLAFVNIRCAVALAFRWISLSFVWTEVVRPISICVIVAAIWLMTSSLNASVVMIVQLIVMIAVAVVLSAHLSRRLNLELASTPPEYETHAWLRIALPLLVISLFGNYFPDFMLILVGAHVPSDQVAIFNASYRLAMIVTFTLTAVEAVTSPVASRLFAAQDFNELQSVVSRAAKLGFGASLASVAVFAILGRTLLGLFGAEFIAGYETMLILLSAQLVRAAAGPVISLLSVTGHQDRCLAVFGVGLIASVVLVFLLVPIFGIRGAAVSVLLVTLGWSIWLQRLVVVHLGVRTSVFASFTRTKK